MKLLSPLLSSALLGTGLWTFNVAAQDWQQTSAPNAYWQGIACSADGAKLVAAEYSDPDRNPGGIFVSRDSGSTWQVTTAPRCFWQRVASSTDGARLVAVAYADANWRPGPIYLSADAGACWSPAKVPDQN